MIGVSAITAWLIGPPRHGEAGIYETIHDLRAIIAGLIGIALAWLWWSYRVPRWRAWALQQGADPDELQNQAERSGLVWPRGSILEKTEFRLRS
jgi:hypothetical protein